MFGHIHSTKEKLYGLFNLHVQLDVTTYGKIFSDFILIFYHEPSLPNRGGGFYFLIKAIVSNGFIKRCVRTRLPKKVQEKGTVVLFSATAPFLLLIHIFYITAVPSLHVSSNTFQ